MSAQGNSQSEDNRLGLLLQDRYRIVRKLGAGGMGDVYEGVHELIGKKLAIKCMHSEFAANAEAVARFKQEARAATAVGNEHIVDVSDMGDLPDGSPFMVMEFLNGQELAALIESENLSIPRVVQIALQILDGLGAAHSRGVVHRDMKPENVFLVERGGNKDFVKILDFGISLIAEQADAVKGRMTQTGVAMGTPHYMSPEQAKGARDVDHRTDIYSVGVILYQALTGQVPFEASSLAVLMAKILTERPESILEFRPEVPRALDRIILRAMAKDADVRFEDAEEFAEALRPFLEEGYTPALAPEEKRSSQSSRDKATIRLSASADLPASEAGATAELPFGGAKASADMPTQALKPGELVGSEEPAVATNTPGPETLLAAGISGKKNWRLPLVGLTVAALGFGVFLIVRKDAGSEPSPPEKSPPPAEKLVRVQADAGQASTSGSEAPLPPKTEEVKIRIDTQPSDAKVYVNGRPFPSGSEVAQLRSLASVRIQVVAQGYQAVDEVSIFDQDRSLFFELKKSELVDQKVAMPRGKKGGKATKTGKQAKGNSETSKPEVDKKPDVDKKPESDKGESKIYKGSKGGVRTDF